MHKLSVVKGDITQQKVDAVVNAANATLLGGGGVDGAIHRAAGPELLEACRNLSGCVTGEAKITAGFNLPASWVIHTVGPVWQDGSRGEEALLADCYRHSLHLAEKCFVRTIAFPSISTGAYGFPVDRASRIAVQEVHDFLRSHPSIEKAVFVCFDAVTFEAYRKAIREIVGLEGES